MLYLFWVIPFYKDITTNVNEQDDQKK